MAGILPPSHVIFIELLTDNEQRVDKYIRSVKLKTAPDYKGWEEAQLQQAFRDYKKRIAISDGGTWSSKTRLSAGSSWWMMDDRWL